MQPSSRLRSITRIGLGVLAGILIGNPILLYVMQERLIFHPVPMDDAKRKGIRDRLPSVNEITLASDDGTKLHGWFQKAARDDRAPLLIYFGGNEEDIAWLFAAQDRIPGRSLAAINYRGYGLSEGEPGERAIFADALRIFDALAKRDDVDPGDVAVMGRSLGSGVATYLATARPVRAVVLVTPYDSIADIASEKFWFAPVSMVLKHRFDSIGRARSIRVAALFMVAADDDQIPVDRSRRLFEAWAGPKQWHLARGEDHSTIGYYGPYWKVIGEFLARPQAPQ